MVSRLASSVHCNRHEKIISCLTALGCGFEFWAAFDRSENWATAAASRYSRSAASPWAGLLLGGGLLVSSGKSLQVA